MSVTGKAAQSYSKQVARTIGQGWVVDSVVMFFRMLWKISTASAWIVWIVRRLQLFCCSGADLAIQFTVRRSSDLVEGIGMRHAGRAIIVA